MSRFADSDGVVHQRHRDATKRRPNPLTVCEDGFDLHQWYYDLRWTRRRVSCILCLALLGREDEDQ